MTNAMDAFPELSARKTMIDMHVQLATKILSESDEDKTVVDVIVDLLSQPSPPSFFL